MEEKPKEIEPGKTEFPKPEKDRPFLILRHRERVLKSLGNEEEKKDLHLS